jgi:long-chain acyl-CoA synthetase
MTDMTKEMPWIKNYEGYPPKLVYPDRTMYGCIAFSAKTFPDHDAFEYVGRNVKYKVMIREIDRIAACFDNLGINEGDKVIICLPNSPQAVYCIYAANRIGAVAVMVHPLSAGKEISNYIDMTGARIAVTLDMFFEKFPIPGKNNTLEHIIVTSPKDEMGPARAMGYQIIQGRKDPKVAYNGTIMSWMDFKTLACTYDAPEPRGGNDSVAMILFSGGTTGKSKGVLLSNMNVNASSMETGIASCCLPDGMVMAAVMPMFHGFGFCVGVHLMLMNGYKCILVPRFTPDSYAKMIAKKKPNHIAGVPTLYEHMCRSKALKNTDLSKVIGIYCGGDTLTQDLKSKFDAFLAERNCTATIREGYGATECVTACCLTPKNPAKQKRGSIGLPFPDTNYMICRVGTEECADYMEDGEICISGPGIMLGYLNEPEETANTLRVHADGITWLHTGDLGHIDSDGYVYFTQRIKRMIVSSGYNIYPSQIESVVTGHPAVKAACAVGVPDELRGSVIRLYIVTEPGVPHEDRILDMIKDLCKENFSKFSCPRQYQFLDELPVTKIGKVAYSELEEMAKKVVVPTEDLPGDGPELMVEDMLDPLPSFSSQVDAVEAILEPTIAAIKTPLDKAYKREKRKG